MKQDEVNKGKPLAVLSYFGILSILPFLISPGNRYAVSHGRQGLCIFACFVVATFFSIVPVIGPLFWTVTSVFSFICMIVGIVNAISGRVWVVPVVGKFFTVNGKE